MAFPRRARSLWGYLRAERRTLRQGLVALVLSTLASFVAGLTLGSITGTLNLLPGLLVLIPASVGMRGTIFGASFPLPPCHRRTRAFANHATPKRAPQSARAMLTSTALPIWRMRSSIVPLNS